MNTDPRARDETLGRFEEDLHEARRHARYGSSSSPKSAVSLELPRPQDVYHMAMAKRHDHAGDHANSERAPNLMPPPRSRIPSPVKSLTGSIVAPTKATVIITAQKEVTIIDVRLLQQALEECWTLCNTMYTVSSSHLANLYDSGKTSERVWILCWAMCQSMYGTACQYLDSPAGTDREVQLARDLYHTLSSSELVHDDELTSKRKITMALSDHLHEGLAEDLSPSFKQKTLDYWLELCDQELHTTKLLSPGMLELVRACWEFVGSLYAVEVHRREDVARLSSVARADNGQREAGDTVPGPALSPSRDTASSRNVSPSKNENPFEDTASEPKASPSMNTKHDKSKAAVLVDAALQACFDLTSVFRSLLVSRHRRVVRRPFLHSTASSSSNTATTAHSRQHNHMSSRYYHHDSDQQALSTPRATQIAPVLPDTPMTLFEDIDIDLGEQTNDPALIMYKPGGRMHSEEYWRSVSQNSSRLNSVSEPASSVMITTSIYNNKGNDEAERKAFQARVVAADQMREAERGRRHESKSGRKGKERRK